MILIPDGDALARALRGSLDPRVRRLLLLRQHQLGTIDGAARFIIVEPGDTITAVEGILAFPLTIDGEPCFEWCLHHDGAFETAFILGDADPADVLLVPDAIDIDPDLLAVCRLHATVPAAP